MIQDLIDADIPLIFVETSEPQRAVEFVESTTKDFWGVWKSNTGLQYCMNGCFESVGSTSTMAEILTYMIKVNKKYLLFLFGEPDYDMLDDIPDHHTLVFLAPAFKDHVGAVRVSLPCPTNAEYTNAFHKIIKPKQNKALVEASAKAAVGMTLKDAKNCFRYSYHTKSDFTKNKALFTKSSFLDLIVSNNTFADLGGFVDFKAWFGQRKYWYKAEGFPKQKGCIIYGPSGVGKSICASCLGNEADLPLYRFDLTKIHNQFVGQSEANMRQALKAIESVAPALIWVEEINRLFSDAAQAHVAHNQVLALFLEWLQEHDKNIFIVATANKIDQIPAELMRPGRFNLKYEAKYPDVYDRFDIFNIYLSKYELEWDVLNYLARESLGLTGADIVGKIEDAVIVSLNSDKSIDVILKEMF